jgi:hypothetical protein
MDHDACRLFNDSQIFVLEVDLERHLLWCEWLRFETPEIDLNGFSAPNPIPGFVKPAFDLNRTSAVQVLNL